MHKEIVVNSTSNEVRIGLMEDHELVEISVERAEVKRVVGNVYKGRVTAVRPGLQAAFVDIGMEKAGFLHVSDLVHGDAEDEDDRGGGRRRGRGRQREAYRPIETMIREGDEILVQVTKEVIGTKGPRLTADISLPGRFLVMMPRGDHVGVSRKIEDRRERARLREMLDKLKPNVGSGAYIIRTAGQGIDQKMLRRDMDHLHGLWQSIEENAGTRQAPALVHEDVGLIVGLVRDIFKEDIDALHIDDREDYEKLIRYVKSFAPELRNRVHHYTGDVPIFDKFGIEAEIKKSLDKKVWLKRGGFLVIEQTEAMVAIDVNTGRFTGKKNQEETIFRTNMMAAKEIPRQLRLRDIGGIIVIDFIDMENEADRRRVLNELRSHLRHDRSRTKTFGVSELGLVEMSRQRVRESLKDQLSDGCPFCRGTGQVLSLETLANKVELLLSKVALRSREHSVQIQANPTLALELLGDRAGAIQRIADDQRLKVSVIEDVRLHREDFRILSLQSRRDLVPELEDGRRREVAAGRVSASERDRGRERYRGGRGRSDGRRGDRGGRTRDRKGSRRQETGHSAAEARSSARSNAERSGERAPSERRRSRETPARARRGRGRPEERDTRRRAAATPESETSSPPAATPAADPVADPVAAPETPAASTSADRTRGPRRRRRVTRRRSSTVAAEGSAGSRVDEKPAPAASQESQGRPPKEERGPGRGRDERPPRSKEAASGDRNERSFNSRSRAGGSSRPEREEDRSGPARSSARPEPSGGPPSSSPAAEPSSPNRTGTTRRRRRRRRRPARTRSAGAETNDTNDSSSMALSADGDSD